MYNIQDFIQDVDMPGSSSEPSLCIIENLINESLNINNNPNYLFGAFFDDQASPEKLHVVAIKKSSPDESVDDLYGYDVEELLERSVARLDANITLRRESSLRTVMTGPGHFSGLPENCYETEYNDADLGDEAGYISFAIDESSFDGAANFHKLISKLSKPLEGSEIYIGTAFSKYGEVNRKEIDFSDINAGIIAITSKIEDIYSSLATKNDQEVNFTHN